MLNVIHRITEHFCLHKAILVVGRGIQELALEIIVLDIRHKIVVNSAGLYHDRRIEKLEDLIDLGSRMQKRLLALQKGDSRVKIRFGIIEVINDRLGKGVVRLVKHLKLQIAECYGGVEGNVVGISGKILAVAARVFMDLKSGEGGNLADRGNMNGRTAVIAVLLLH